MSTSESTTPAGGPSPEELKRALKAFKKRLKLTQLDAESKFGVGPLTGSGKSRILAITPPNQYPRAVWDELARQGKIKHDGQGLFSLIEGPGT
jgi:hypothetical protein